MIYFDYAMYILKLCRIYENYICELRSEELCEGYRLRSSQLHTQVLQLRKESLQAFFCDDLPSHNVYLTNLGSHLSQHLIIKNFIVN